MGALPEFRVEVAWDASPADVMLQNSPTPPSVAWTDITQYVHLPSGVSASRGRQAEDDVVTAGALQLTLKPAATTLAAQMRIRTPIRLSIRHPRTTGTWKPLWTGTVDDWGVRWDNGTRIMLPLHASDMVARYASKTVEALPVQAILATNPVWCYPLDEADNTPAAADRAGTTPNTPLLTWVDKGTITTEEGSFGGLFSPGSPPNEAESTTAKFAPNTAGTVGRYLSSGTSEAFAHPEIGTVANGQTIQAFVYVAGTSSRVTSVLDLRGWLVDVALDLMPSWKPRARVGVYGTGIVAEVTSATAITTDGWHHVALTQSQSGATVTLTLYVDGVSSGTATYTGPLLTAGSFEISAGAFSGSDLFFGNLANIAAHNRALSSTEIADIAATRDGLNHQQAVARAYTIARWSGVSAKIPTTGLGDSKMQPQITKGSSVADALTEAATAELSPWFAKADGTFAMSNRAARYAPPISFTLPARTVGQSTEFATSDQFLINKASITRTGGTTITVKNEPSIARYSVYESARTVNLDNDADVLGYANALVNRYNQPASRTDALAVYVTAVAADLDATTPGTVAKITEAEIGTALQVTGLPTGAPASTMTFIVEGVSDDFGTAGWVRSFNVSPAVTAAAWRLGVAGYSELGKTTRLAF